MLQIIRKKELNTTYDKIPELYSVQKVDIGVFIGGVKGIDCKETAEKVLKTLHNRWK